MTGPRKGTARDRAADPVRNPFVRSPLPADTGFPSALNLLHDAIGNARAAVDLERVYSTRAEGEGDVRGATSHDLLAQTHDAYATVLVLIARTLRDEAEARGDRP